jgi:hypothetical protein
VIDDAFSKAASVSSTVSKTVVCKELSAPPAEIAIALAASECRCRKANSNEQ